MSTLTKKRTSQYTPKPFKFTISKLQKMYEVGILEPNLRIELIEGEPIVIAPIGFKHAKTLERLEKKFYEILSKSNENYIIWSQNPVKISDRELLYPDIAIFPESIYKKEEIPQIKEAVLIIEISDTTLEYDKNVKIPIYAKGCAKEVWIVNLKENIIEKFSNTNGKIFKNIYIFQQDDVINIFNTNFRLKDIL